MTHITCAFMPHDIQDCLCFGQISIQKISFFSRYGSKFPTSQLSAEEIAPGHLFITPSKHEAFEGMPYKADMPIKAYALVQVLAPKATMPNQVFERHWVCVCVSDFKNTSRKLACMWLMAPKEWQGPWFYSSSCLGQKHGGNQLPTKLAVCFLKELVGWQYTRRVSRQKLLPQNTWTWKSCACLLFAELRFRTGKPFHHTKCVLTGQDVARRAKFPKKDVAWIWRLRDGYAAKAAKSLERPAGLLTARQRLRKMISAEQASRSPCLQSSTDLDSR